jgi:hypothetical protein
VRRLMSSSAVSGPTVLRRLVGPGLVGRLVLRLPTRLVGRLLTREPEGASSGPGSAPDRITCGTKTGDEMERQRQRTMEEAREAMARVAAGFPCD